MAIFCDRLSLGACIKILRLRRRNLLSKGKTRKIYLLDPLPRGPYPMALRMIIQKLGFHIEEAVFFAGHLRTPDGQSVYLTAGSVSNDLSLKTAELILSRSDFLAQLNKKWGRNTIKKYIARTLKMPALQFVRRLKVAEALGHAIDDEEMFLIVQRWFAFDMDLVYKYTNNIKIIFYRPWSYESIKRSRTIVLFLLFFAKFREVIWRLVTLIQRESEIKRFLDAVDKNMPTLLVLEEDDLSLDRSFRTQPHWLFDTDGDPLFQTLVFRTGGVKRSSSDMNLLMEKRILVVSKKVQYLLHRRSHSSVPVRKKLRVDIIKCLYKSFFGS